MSFPVDPLNAASKKRKKPPLEASSRWIKRRDVDGMLNKLDAHQEEIYEHIVSQHNPRLVVALGMGLGKTMIALAVLCKLTNRCQKRTLIAVPSAVCNQWYQAAMGWVDTLGAGDASGAIALVTDTIQRLPWILSPMVKVVIVSHTRITNDYRATGGFSSNLFDARFDFIIIDEVHMFRNPRTSSCDALRHLVKKANCPVLGLTGTPAVNYPADIATIFSVINLQAVSVHGGGAIDLCDKKEWTVPVYDDDGKKATGLSELAVEAAQRFLVRGSGAGLPRLPCLYQKVVYFKPKLDKRARAFYNELLIDAQNLLGRAERKNVLTLMQKMRMLLVASPLVYDPHWGSLAGEPSIVLRTSAAVRWAQTHTNGLLKKLRACVFDALSETPDGFKRVIVACELTSMMEVAEAFMRTEKSKKMLGNVTFSTFSSQVHREDREEVVRQFLTTSNAVMLMSIKAGGTGINVTPGCHRMVVFGATPWSPATLDQLHARIHRKGCAVEHDVHVVQLMAKGSVDEAIVNTLHDSKKKLIDAITKDEHAACSAWREAERVLPHCRRISMTTGNFVQ